MKKLILCLTLGIIISSTSYGQSRYLLPIECEISENAINLFLLKEYNDLGNATSVSLEFEGIEFSAELLPFVIDLQDGGAVLNFSVRVSLEDLTTVVGYSHFVSLEINGSNELSVDLIIGEVRSGIQNSPLPTAIEDLIIDAFDDLSIHAYPDVFVQRLNQQTIFQEHPVEFTTISDLIVIEEDAINITVTFDLLAEAPKIEMMVDDNNTIHFRSNFSADYGEIIVTKNNNSPYIVVPLPGYFTSEKSYWIYTEDPEIWTSCIIHFTTSKNVYKAYFNLDSFTPGEWVDPVKFI